MIKALAQKNVYSENHPFKKITFKEEWELQWSTILLNNYELDSGWVLRFIGSRSNICRSRDTRNLPKPKRKICN
jgi:hypothetical protein